MDELRALSVPYVIDKTMKTEKKNLLNMVTAPILAKRVDPSTGWSVKEKGKISCNISERLKELLMVEEGFKPSVPNFSLEGSDEFSKNFFECVQEKKLVKESFSLQGPLEGKTRTLSENSFKVDKDFRDRLGNLVSACTVLDLAKQLCSPQALKKLNLPVKAHVDVSMMHDVLSAGIGMLESTVHLFSKDFKEYRVKCRELSLGPLQTESIKSELLKASVFTKGAWAQDDKEKVIVSARQAQTDGTLRTSGPSGSRT